MVQAWVVPASHGMQTGTVTASRRPGPDHPSARPQGFSNQWQRTQAA